MSTVTPSAEGSEGTDATSRVAELRGLIGELMAHLRSHGTGEQTADQQVLPPGLAQLQARGDAALARLQSALAERSASAAQEDPSGGQNVLGWIIGLLEVYTDILADAKLLDSIATEEYLLEKAPIRQVDPIREYWYERSDGPAEHRFFEDGSYVTLTIPPAATAAYWNAEIYNNSRTHIEPRNILIDPVPPDSPKTKQEWRNYKRDWLLNLPYIPANQVVFQARIRAENLKGGSRGWGFWNMSVSPQTMQVAWFVQYDGVKTGDGTPAVPSGFYAETQNGTKGLDSMMFRLPDLDEDWHDYRIELNQGSVFYFIDGNLVHQVWGAAAPAGAMGFHCWVDNAVFGFDGLDVTHICQSTAAPRSNVVHSMSIVSPPDGTATPSPAASGQN
jgi:hypothetical protein